MTDYSGRLIEYGLAHEATRGTYLTPTYWMRWETADFYNKATTQFNQSAIGVLDRYSGAEIMENSSTGQISGKITDRAIGNILYGVFGTYAVALHSTETIIYDHTFTEAQSNTGASLSVTRVSPNARLHFTNAMVGSFEVTAKAGDFVRHATNFTAFYGVTGTGTAPAFIAENEFKGKHVTTKIAANVAGLAAALAIPTASLKLTINKNLMPYYIIGQDGPSDIFAQSIEVNGEFVLRFTDSTYEALRFANTKQALSLAIVNTDVLLGTAAAPSLIFTLPAVYLNDFKPEQGIDNIVTQTVSFTGTYDLTTSKTISAVLTNAVTTY